MKKCIVSFGNSSNNYVHGISRLSESLRNNFDGDFLAFIGEASCGAPLHTDNPYAFKIYCIEKAIEAGYHQVLWLDSSCFAVRPVQPIFDMISRQTFAFQDSGHWLGEWANDRSLEYFSLSRDAAMDMRMIGNAGFLGFDTTCTLGSIFFKGWKQSMLDNIFKGAWNNNEKTESQDERCRGHRHDMVCSSAIIHRMGLKGLMAGGEEILQYAGLYDPILNDSIIIKAQGI